MDSNSVYNGYKRGQTPFQRRTPVLTESTARLQQSRNEGPLHVPAKSINSR
jgi:hypothetical protein